MLVQILWPMCRQPWPRPQGPMIRTVRCFSTRQSVTVSCLRTQLSTTGGLTAGIAGNTPLDRLNAIEAELQRLTAKTEEVEFRVNRITVDGTNRIGDLEFRLGQSP